MTKKEYVIGIIKYSIFIIVVISILYDLGLYN